MDSSNGSRESPASPPRRRKMVRQACRASLGPTTSPVDVDVPSELVIQLSAGVRDSLKVNNDPCYSHLLVALGVALIRHEQLFQGFAVLPRLLSIDLCDDVFAVFELGPSDGIRIRLVIGRELNETPSQM